MPPHNCGTCFWTVAFQQKARAPKTLVMSLTSDGPAPFALEGRDHGEHLGTRADTSRDVPFTAAANGKNAATSACRLTGASTAIASLSRLMITDFLRCIWTGPTGKIAAGLRFIEAAWAARSNHTSTS